MKKNLFRESLSARTGSSTEELVDKQQLMEKLEKLIGVKLDTYPARTPFVIVEYINKVVFGLGDLSFAQQIRLPLQNDNLPTDKFEFALVSERSPLREVLEDTQKTTGDHNSTVVIDHNQYRVIHSGAGGTLLGKSDFHLYQVDTDALRTKLNANHHNLLNFLLGNNHSSIH